MRLNHQHIAKIFSMLMLGLFLLIATGMPAQSKSKPNSIAWSVRIYPKDHAYLEIIVDPRKVPAGYSIQGIRYEVHFYTTWYKYMATESFLFSEQEITDREHVFRDYVPNPYVRAAVVIGGNISYALHSIGSAYLCPDPNGCDPMYSESANEWTPLEATTGQQNIYPNVTRAANGTLHASKGYMWVDPDDQDDKRVKLRPGLVRTFSGFRLAEGYRWVHPNDPDDLRVEPNR